ncbi:MAG TPA: discoidin domain-containing protein [Pyrinomonadaceae bacterium]|nr:discoidin domain-containing protein [Pyrinomonadaceae bacterium]
MKIIRLLLWKIFPGLVALLFTPSVWAGSPISLDGYWRFEIDPTDAGERAQWFNREFRNGIRLPGILQTQYNGDPISTKTEWVMSRYDRFWFLRDDYKTYTEIGKVKVPFLSQPFRHYLGAAWYQRDIQIPTALLGRRVVLKLERPHWTTTVWIDSQKIGSDKSLVAPHIYDLGSLTPGRHRLTIRVDNRPLPAYRPDAGAVSDALGANWNGIAGKIELTDTGRVWIDDVKVFPNLAQKSMLIRVRIGNQTGRSGSASLTAVWPDIGVVPADWDEKGGTAEVEVPLRPDVETWDEFHPKLLPLRLWLRGNGVDENYEVQIGLRDFRAEGKEFRLNGRPVIFRGTQHDGGFPLTGYPPTDVSSWSKFFETAKQWGLNHVRFHSWCPPEAAFAAADRLGFYLQLEVGAWNESSPAAEGSLYEETDRMINAYGNHPSFMLLSAGSDPKSAWKVALSKWVDRYRKEDPRRLYAGGTGHTEREVADLTESTDYLAEQHIGVNRLRRESGWFGGDYAPSLADVNLPVIAHEVGQWAAYPDYDLIKKFTGYLQPGNYEIFRDSLKEHGLQEKNKQFASASGRFQLACYKEEIEANLRTSGLSGFQLRDLHDGLGAGAAPVGLLDPFWEPKSYVGPEEFKQFCNTTVPLARLRQRVFTTNDTMTVDVEVAQYGAEPIENALAVWKIVGGEGAPRGEWPARTIPIGKNIPLGKIVADLSKLVAPAEYRLVVTVAPLSFFSSVDRRILPAPDHIRGVTYFENEWNFWVYPAANVAAPAPACPLTPGADVLVTRAWDEAEKRLAAGGRVLFVPSYSDLAWNSPPLDSVPIFGNRLMTPAWGRMLGLLVDRKLGETKSHALDLFPSADNFDWQWAQIIPNVRAFNLESFPADLEPVVWAIDDWNRNYKLGVIFEGALGDGRLLVCAFDVTNPNSSNPVTRQLRNSLIQYMKSDCFQPNITITTGQIQSLLFDTRVMRKLGAVAEIGGARADNVIDGDPETYVLVGDSQAQIREPVDIVITFPTAVAMSGVVLMPRQNSREHEGDIREFIIQTSDDGNDWRDVLRGELVSTFAPQQVEFSRPITARYLKLISLTGFGPDQITTLAELAVITTSKKPADKKTKPRGT